MRKIITIILIVLVVIILIIGVLLKRNTNDIVLNYEIITNTYNIIGTKNKEYKGHEVIEKDNEYYLIIYGGERPTTDSLEIIDVNIENKNVKVTVKYKLGSGDAFSYPKAVIKFDNEPKNVKVIYK